MTPPRTCPPGRASSALRKILLLGLGNDILGDDAVGLQVVRQVEERLGDCETVEVLQSAEMGLALLDHIAGFDEVVLVDAVRTGAAPPGFLHQLDITQLPVQPLMAPHFVGIGETLALGRALGLPMPERVQILAIEVEDPFTVSTELTQALKQALPSLVEQVAGKLDHILSRARSNPAKC